MHTMKNNLVPSLLGVDALSALITVLERVKANGGKLNDDGIWFDAPPMDGHYGPLDELKALKTHKKTLLCLRKALEKRIIPVQNLCDELTLQVGIQSVPVEILQQILVATHLPAEKGNEQSISVSHVCRSFRTVALRTPELWSTVSSFSPLAETREFLKRSAPAPLTIVFPTPFPSPSHPSIKKFLKVIMSHSSRWCDLDIHVMHEMFIPAIPHPLQLPLLRSLTHGIYDDDSVPLFAQYGRSQLLYPTLHSYVAVNFLIKIDKPCNNLRFVDVPHSNPTPTGDASVYPSITTFSLCVGPGYSVDTMLDYLLESFSLPNLVDFRLGYLNPVSVSMAMITRLKHPDGPIPFQTLRSMSISGAGNSYGERETCLELCGCLLELLMEGIEGGLLRSDSGPLMEKRLPLQTLMLRHCDDVTADEIDLLVEQLREGPNWETFQRLEITCCKKLTEDFFLTIEDEMEGKLVWTTCG
ncbi:hypothetical protein BD410DRAFT_830215 [Rickenella mellea]|uniref:F-box domain-containing protein n=1 Tax=Rickenella mellea TaxID=50990 RepID=A0A4Y7PW08_9AGAM|nr:hypothetical protein BD410DRAFT_830215 [Rickenella mellea]